MLYLNVLTVYVLVTIVFERHFIENLDDLDNTLDLLRKLLIMYTFGLFFFFPQDQVRLRLLLRRIDPIYFNRLGGFIGMVSRVLTVSSVSNYISSQKKYVTFPVIRLQGKWLEELGFSTGHKVTVSIHKDRLVIKLMNNN